jgi:Class II Aldolase and Adducin N-terminal domain
MKETGTVKFHYQSSGRALAPFPGFKELNAARQELRRLGLLGVDKSGIGFGNASLRNGTADSFYITGSGTGGLSSLGLKDYAKVIEWDFERNWLRCEGQVIASAESLTHAAVYSMAAEVRVVLHGHDRRLWRSLCERVTATSSLVSYGTPGMALEVQRLLRESDVCRGRTFAMAGHRDGIVAFGQDFRQALGALAEARAESN